MAGGGDVEKVGVLGEGLGRLIECDICKIQAI